MAEKLNNFEKFERKKKKEKKNSALFSTQRPPDDWPDSLDYLAIGLVANKCTKLAKISEILLLSLWLSYMKIPLCYVLYNYVSLFSQIKLNYSFGEHTIFILFSFLVSKLYLPNVISVTS